MEIVIITSKPRTVTIGMPPGLVRLGSFNQSFLGTWIGFRARMSPQIDRPNRTRAVTYHV